jgi:hypothetical protein
MTKLFRGSDLRRLNQQHLQLTVDIVPNQPLSETQAQEIINKVLKAVGDLPGAIGAKSHPLTSCETRECGGLMELLAKADQKYHDETRTEH